MLHELLFALLGHTGDIFEKNSFKVAAGFPFLHPSEEAIMNNIASVGKLYSKLIRFLERPNSFSFEIVLKSALHKWLDEYRAKVMDLERACMEEGNIVTVAYIQQEIEQVPQVTHIKYC